MRPRQPDLRVIAIVAGVEVRATVGGGPAQGPVSGPFDGTLRANTISEAVRAQLITSRSL